MNSITNLITQGESKTLEFKESLPKIEKQNDFVDVEFFCPQTNEMDDKVSDSIGYVSDSVGYVSEQEEKVLNFIKINSLITSKQVEELLQVKEARARKLLKQMCENNLLIKLGSARSTHYKALTNE